MPRHDYYTLTAEKLLAEDKLAEAILAIAKGFDQFRDDYSDVRGRVSILERGEK